MLPMSRAGVGCATVSRISKPRFGSSACMSLASPLPNSPSSCTSTTVFAGLPAASFSVARLSRATDATLPKPGAKRNVLASPRETMLSDTPTSTT